MKVNAVPAVSVTVAALLNAGVLLTVSTNAWLAVPVEFLAVKVIGYGPLAAAVGVPGQGGRPVALPAVNVMPGGSVPAWVSVGVGVPAVVTVKLNAVPEVADAEAALVMASPLFTVRTKLCVAVPPSSWP